MFLFKVMERKLFYRVFCITMKNMTDTFLVQLKIVRDISLNKSSVYNSGHFLNIYLEENATIRRDHGIQCPNLFS